MGTQIKQNQVQGLPEALAGKADIATRLQMAVIETEFLSNITPFAQGLVGTAFSAGTVVEILGEPNHPGIVELRDSTTAGGGYRIMTGVSSFRLAGNEKFVCVFQMRGVRSTAVCRLGFLDATTATAPVDGAYIDIVGNGTTLTATGRARNNNVETATTETFAVANNTWYTCMVELNSDATAATFTIFNEAGVQQWQSSVASNVPKAVNREVGAGVIVAESTTDAAAGIVRLDYMRLEIGRALIR